MSWAGPSVGSVWFDGSLNIWAVYQPFFPILFLTIFCFTRGGGAAKATRKAATRAETGGGALMKQLSSSRSRWSSPKISRILGWSTDYGTPVGSFGCLGWGLQCHDMWPHLLRIFLLSWGTDCSGGGWTGARVWQEKRRVSLGFSWPKCVSSWWESPWKCCHLERPKQSCVSLLRLCFCTMRVRPFYSRPGKKSCCITVPATPCWRVDRTDLGDFWRFSCNERSWQDAAPTTLVRQVSPQNFDEVLRRAARDGSSITVYLSKHGMILTSHSLSVWSYWMKIGIKDQGNSCQAIVQWVGFQKTADQAGRRVSLNYRVNLLGSIEQ